MKKLYVKVLLGMMTMGILTGCGKSEEEKAMDEMTSHMIAEAREDGVDLEKMLEEEYAAYEERHAEKQKEIDAHNAFVEVIHEGAKEPIAAYTAYKNAITSREILASAKDYNKAYDEYLKLANGDEQKEIALVSYLRKQNLDSKCTEILESIYEIKAAYVDCADKERFEEARFYYNLDEDSAYIVFEGKDEETYMNDEFLILKRDGSTCSIDVSSVMTESTSLVQAIGFVEDMYIIYTVDNAEYKYWAFDINESEAKGEATTTNYTEYQEHWFMNTFEELNYGEPN